MDILRHRKRAGSEEFTHHDESFTEEEPEPFDEMYSTFRIVALYELLLHGQWQYVLRYTKTKKTELVVGMYIGAAFELVRAICAITMAIVLILMRLSVLVPFQTDRIVGNINWIASQNAFAFWLCIILVAVIIAQFAIYQCKSHSKVVIVTTINFVFSVLLICMVVHAAVMKDNNEEFIKEGFHKKVLQPAEDAVKTLSNLQARMKCCGVDGPTDYRQTYLIRYKNPLNNRTEEAPMTREFAIDGTSFYSLPISCCRKNAELKVCSQRNLTAEDVAEAKKYRANNQWDMMLKFFTLPEPGTYFPRGCVTEFLETSESYITIFLVVLIIFTIFTGLTIGFVIVYLLYHDGVGHMVAEQKMFGVERNTGVHFLMSLDMMESSFHDDFSFIEFLRNTDIDKFMASDRLQDEIGGRKDAEMM